MKRHLMTLLSGSIIAFTIMGLLVLSCPEKAEASLIGDTITWQYYFNGGTYNEGGSPGTFIAGSTSNDFFALFSLSANESQIIIDYINAYETGWASHSTDYDGDNIIDFPGLYTEGNLSIYSGIMLTNINKVFTSVEIESNNMVGFTSSNVTWNANKIAINWDGLEYNSNTMIVLNVVTPNTDGPPTSVPEPATMLLIGSGLVGLLAGRRMLKR